MRNQTLNTTESTIKSLADGAADQADEALAASRKVANHAIDTMQAGLDELRQATPGALSRTAAQVDDMARRSIERAREASAEMRTQVVRAQDATTGYIKDEPMKSVLIAAAAGAAVAGLIGWLVRSRRNAA